MLVKKLILKDFRNLENTVLDVCTQEIILTGENGQGKTNLLEALYILCYGSSFRTQKLADCIRHGCDNFMLGLVYGGDDALDTEILVSYGGNSKEIRIDGREIKDRRELIYNLPCIVFAHDDIEFVRGEPENRRRFFNQTMTMYDMGFFDNLRHYSQILRQRNAAIKDARTQLLDFYDARLAHYGLSISREREKVCAAFNSIFPDIYNQVSGEERKTVIDYRPSWSPGSREEEIIEKLRLQKETDIHMGTTTSGPHRDRFVLIGDSGLFVNSASTGQMRLASIVMRITQASFFRHKTGRNPILLVDDVLLELDTAKRNRCFSAFGKYSQAFFTFLPQEKYFSDSDSSAFRKLHVTNGVFENEKG